MPQQTGDQPKALKPALESMTLLVAAVIVHDRATSRVVPAKGQVSAPQGRSQQVTDPARY
ncbi:hypothetical protein [Streptomyces sp. SID8016]|uniref:hypothetical protein n=1 Tax=Streptomyces sp. SID8016 TaxID=2706098 RepID=UPI001EF3B518